MASRTLKFAIFGNTYQVKKSAFINNIIATLKESGAEVSIDSEFYRFLVEGGRLSMPIDHVFHDGDFDADFVVSMGGDGTFLKAASRVGSKEIPIIGINTGRLGFLADIASTDIVGPLNRILDGDYVVEEHTALELDCGCNSKFEGRMVALNEIAVLKQDSSSMITIQTELDDQHLVDYQADGLIIATPTGSTAYSMSAGGPITHPHLECFCVTPICPHSLAARPMVFPDSLELTVRNICEREKSLFLTIDGRTNYELFRGETVSITKSDKTTRLITLKERGFYNTLRQKMTNGH